MWTLFWDMHSGGWLKLSWSKIYVEAHREAAFQYFQERWGLDPEHVTCECCGPDYAIYTESELAQLTGHHRRLRCVETKRDPATGLYLNDDPNVRYLEEGESPPPGYDVSYISEIRRRHSKPLTLEEYVRQPDVLIVPASEVEAFRKQEVRQTYTGSAEGSEKAHNDR